MQIVYLVFFQEFIQIGYYINNEYDDEELQETPPEKPILEKIIRDVLYTDPRITKFNINWNDEIIESENNSGENEENSEAFSH